MRVPKLNGVVFQNRKILSYHKKVERTLSDFQMFTNFATSESLQIANESLKYYKKCESLFDLREVVRTAIDAISFLAKATHFLSAERRFHLKLTLN